MRSVWKWMRTPREERSGSLLPAVLIFLVLTSSLYACGEPSPYDSKKASSLSEERRRQLDILLVNELATWDKNSTRCNYATAYQCREDYFKQLASEGYEVADIVSRIFKPTQGIVVNDLNAYKRLRKLADDGDKSALCITPYVFQHTPANAWPYTGETEAKYTKQGLSFDLPVCKLNEFYSYWSGVDGYPENREMAETRLHEAAVAGLYQAQDILAAHYYAKDKFNDYQTIKKILCWARVADFHSSWSNLSGYVADLKEAAWERGKQGSVLIHPEYMQLAHEWDTRVTPYAAKKTTPLDCKRIEEEQ